jgi:hypothetical protein
MCEDLFGKALNNRSKTKKPVREINLTSGSSQCEGFECEIYILNLLISDWRRTRCVQQVYSDLRLILSCDFIVVETLVKGVVGLLSLLYNKTYYISRHKWLKFLRFARWCADRRTPVRLPT